MIGELQGARPGVDADDGDRARWLARKSDVFERIAQLSEADGDVVAAGEARAEAAQALAVARAVNAAAFAELRAGAAQGLAAPLRERDVSSAERQRELLDAAADDADAFDAASF